MALPSILPTFCWRSSVNELGDSPDSTAYGGLAMWKTNATSSNIDWIAYEIEDSELYVGFIDGSVYAYFDVPEFVAEDFVNSSSKGSFLHRNIRDVYHYQRLG